MKATSGIGAFGAGVILAFVGFPEGAKAGEILPPTLDRLAWTEPMVAILLQIAALVLVLAYPINRTMHEANLRKLAERSQKRP